MMARAVLAPTSTSTGAETLRRLRRLSWLPSSVGCRRRRLCVSSFLQSETYHNRQCRARNDSPSIMCDKRASDCRAEVWFRLSVAAIHRASGLRCERVRLRRLALSLLRPSRPSSTRTQCPQRARRYPRARCLPRRRSLLRARRRLLRALDLHHKSATTRTASPHPGLSARSLAALRQRQRARARARARRRDRDAVSCGSFACRMGQVSASDKARSMRIQVSCIPSVTRAVRSSCCIAC
ncbi:hypothetical protein EXIGLDRAFT_329509 [Exidia glandulosa HHB12029]|uniref:Uncharacterized protein n=1 Tax=Exidia glandulosa HHB12029 TaxID=1314781 RepID=A0A165ZIW0_EXIGL|nr:hypothetical protein EXIGLDRAFT_329509 [Exidia glandulosa HHB12029]